MLSALRNFALTFLIAALIFGTIAYFIVGFVLDTLTVTISAEDPVDTNEIELVLPEDTTTEASTDTTVPVVDDISGDTFNILLIGTDYQPDVFDDYNYEETYTGTGFPDKRSRKVSADMMVILRIDKENRKFMFCPLPRNVRVSVNGNNTQLGDVYAEKGIEFLCGKVSGLTGLVMNYHAVVDVSVISECVEILGGVNYYVPQDMQYEDPTQNLVINLEQGTQNIDGEKAEQLLRYVGYSNGNTGRMNTTIQFAQALLAKFTNVTYLTKAPELYASLKEHITTNFTADDLVNNLDLIFAYSKFEAVTVTYPGQTKSYDGVVYFDPNVPAAMDIFDSYQ